jgi:hypothetical protein
LDGPRKSRAADIYIKLPKLASDCVVRLRLITDAVDAFCMESELNIADLVLGEHLRIHVFHSNTSLITFDAEPKCRVRLVLRIAVIG